MGQEFMKIYTYPVDSLILMKQTGIVEKGGVVWWLKNKLSITDETKDLFCEICTDGVGGDFIWGKDNRKPTVTKTETALC